jgi:hypothetical protein
MRQRDQRAAYRDAGIGGQADEGITPEALAALDGFKQIGKRLVGQLEIQRQWRIEIGKGLGYQRDAVITLRG